MGNTDDFYSLNDDGSGGDNYENTDNFSSTTSYWWTLLQNSTDPASGSQLVPAEDINPNVVYATFLVNLMAFVVLMTLYELLSQWFPSVYNQRYSNPSQLSRGGKTTANDETTNGTADKNMATAPFETEGGSLHIESLPPPTSKTTDNVDESPRASAWGAIYSACAGWSHVYSTPWSLVRESAGLDAYMFLRYIRMNMKITLVTSFWACAILCPIYYTGGGKQIGFYQISMANVRQADKLRIWVPTLFLYAFTAYCMFVMRREMRHYVDLRMRFLGVGDAWGDAATGGSKSYASSALRGGPAFGEDVEGGMDEAAANGATPPAGTILPPNQFRSSFAGAIQWTQHRFSLKVEKVPPALRSSKALQRYFESMFPGKVHSTILVMNVPDLDALSTRQFRVVRRLEKSIARYHATDIRPTHITGRPRYHCCGIESTPIAFFCCHDSCTKKDEYPREIYDHIPGKGVCVDSISYYTCDLAEGNAKMANLQRKKYSIASSSADGSVLKEDSCLWYSAPLEALVEGATFAAKGLKEEFETTEEDMLVEEEEYWNPLKSNSDFSAANRGSNLGGYGSLGGTSSTAVSPLGGVDSVDVDDGNDKGARLIDEDHLFDSAENAAAPAAQPLPPPSPTSRPIESATSGTSTKTSGRGSRRPHTWLRKILWTMGLDFFAEGLDLLKDKTDLAVDRPNTSSTGFVTFNSIAPVTICTSAPLTYRSVPIEVSVAPEPRDVIWENIQVDRSQISGREFVANGLLSLGVLLWSIPLTFIQAWAKVENIAAIPGLDWIDKIGGMWKPFINGYLPVVTLLGLISLLPVIFNWIATSYEQKKTFSEVESSIVGRYFYYQLANIYISVSAGTLLISLSEILDNPKQLLVILGQTLPTMAGYFISLLITKILAGLPMVLLRVGALSRMIFLRTFFRKNKLTQRELDEVYRKDSIKYGWEYPTQFLVIIICFTYSCITPPVLLVGALYFFCAMMVYKKQALFVYTPRYESGGILFPQAVSKTLFALVVSQLTFIGYTLIRSGRYQSIILAPLPILTVYFTFYINSRYVEPSTKLSLERAFKLDYLAAKGKKEYSVEFNREAYCQPVLREEPKVPMSYRRGVDDFTLEQVLMNMQSESESIDGSVSSSPSLI